MEKKEIGTVEPKYKTENGKTLYDEFAFIYGAIEKYGDKPENFESLRKYILEIFSDGTHTTKIKRSPIVTDGWCVMLERKDVLTFRGEQFTIPVKYWHDIKTGYEFTDTECGDFMWDLFRAYCEKHYDTFTEIWPEMKKEEKNADSK